MTGRKSRSDEQKEYPMKKNSILIMVGACCVLAGCAAVVPQELANAREAYRRASTSETATIAPAELHVGEQALAKAEQSFQESPDSYRTRDLAYVAERKIQMAEATASISVQNDNEKTANSDYRTAQGNALAQSKQDLSQSNKALNASEQSGKMTAAQLAEAQKAQAAAEQRTAEAMAALAKLAAVKDEPRGMVITLSGSVLFASGKAELLPAARARLDQVADVLLTDRDRHLTIEGHTDSQGSAGYNMNLSQRRADAVRNYLVQRDYRSDRINARGIGEGRPVADNDSAEGRANNRRVEIIVDRESQVSAR
jgi:outer membrane protein OmpA-like peptidoglycan-associated protein